MKSKRYQKFKIRYKGEKHAHINLILVCAWIFIIAIYNYIAFIFDLQSRMRVNTVFTIISIIVIAVIYKFRFTKVKREKYKIKRNVSKVISSFGMYIASGQDKKGVSESVIFDCELSEYDCVLLARKTCYRWDKLLSGNDLLEVLETAVGGQCYDKRKTNDRVSYKFRIKERGRIEYDSDKDYGTSNKIQITHTNEWVYDKQPHGLIVGGTGSGKTYYSYYLLNEFAKRGAYLFIVDPKKMDFSEVKDTGYRVATENADIFKIVKDVYTIMEQRSGELSKNKKLEFCPVVLYIDEYPSLMASMDKKQKEDLQSYVSQIVFKGRAARVFIIIGAQRPDANYINGAMRDNLSLRIALGFMSDDGYKMVFGTGGAFESCEAQNGYFYIGGSNMSVAEKFETQKMVDGYNFIDNLKKTISVFQNEFEKTKSSDTALNEVVERFNYSEGESINNDEEWATDEI